MCAIHQPSAVLTRCRSTSANVGLWGKGKSTCALTRASSAPAIFHDIPTCIPCCFEEEVADRLPEFRVVNWNVAAPNKNPFEYWATHEDERYNELMASVQQCIDHPEIHDFEIGDVFTSTMFNELKEELAKHGISNLDQLEQKWTTDLATRKAIGGFLKDVTFGEKRLISMPDRMTNSIKTESGQECCRPSPITGSQEEMKDMADWWRMWKDFMFKTSPCVRGNTVSSVLSLLEIIPRAKYPALTEEEEAMSIPLQTLCLAIFDAIFTHLLFTVAGDTWQPLKRSLHKALFENKTASCVAILQRQYRDADLIFVQEASESFALAAAEACAGHFVLHASGVDGRRSQMSLILAKRSSFTEASARDLTDEVLGRLKLKCVQKGDLSLFEVWSPSRGPCLLASFHGDSGGLATVPVLGAVEGLARERFPAHTLIVGLDANTASGPQADGGALSVGGFEAFLAEKGLGSCWAGQEPESVWTTFHARTFLQPQLQKAVGLAGVLSRGNMQLKDWIVFYGAQLTPHAVARDNTGAGEFVTAVMPSLRFPSDHAVVAATLRRR